MLIPWMAYATLLASLVYGGALAMERVAAIWRGGQRFIWIAGLLVAIVTPVMLATRPQPAAPAASSSPTSLPPERVSDVRLVARSTQGTTSVRPTVTERASRALVALDPYARVAWLVASLVWLALVGRAAMVVRRQGTRWRTLDLDGASVLVTPDLGPAVIGLARPRVIIPEWALSLDAQARALMLRHEIEHIRARDPLLLFVAAAAVALFPWNVPLRLLVRRLRLAIEIDCDRRVLRASAHEREYGLLLLTVGARQNASLPIAASLAARRPFLEWRIRAMTAPQPRNPRLITSACIALALVATTAAVRTPRPASLARQAAPVVTQTPSPAAVPQAPAVATPVVSATAPRPVARRVPAPVQSADAVISVPTVSIMPRPAAREIPIEVIRALIKQYYPNLLTETGGTITVAFVFDANGNYVTSRGDVVWPNGDGTVRRQVTTQVSSALLDSFSVIAMEKRGRGAAAGDAMADSVAVGERIARLKVALDSVRQLKLGLAAGIDDANAFGVRGRGARVGGGGQPSATPDILSNLVDPDLIQSVEVRKFPPGTLVVGAIGVIVVQLKPTGAE